MAAAQKEDPAGGSQGNGETGAAVRSAETRFSQGLGAVSWLPLKCRSGAVQRQQKKAGLPSFHAGEGLPKGAAILWQDRGEEYVCGASADHAQIPGLAVIQGKRAEEPGGTGLSAAASQPFQEGDGLLQAPAL